MSDEFEYSGYDSSVALLNLIPRKPEVEEIHYDDFDNSSMRHIVDGSNSNIFKTLHKKLGKTKVIVKIIKRNPPDATHAWREFALEHEILSRTRHENLVGYHGGGNNSERRPFLVLEKLDGGSLMNLLSGDAGNTPASPFSYRRCLEIAKQFADALEYLHYNFHPDVIVLHRDLKPDNVGFDGDGVLKLMDFGLCACIPRGNTDGHQAAYSMTGNTGSLRYMAPEVVKNEPYNEKVDVYSYGLIMWQVATGMQPFTNIQRSEFAARVTMGNERPPVNMKPSKKCHLSTEMVQIITECWDTDSRLRCSAQDMSRMLCELLAREPAEEKSSMSKMFSSFTGGKTAKILGK